MRSLVSVFTLLKYCANLSSQVMFSKNSLADKELCSLGKRAGLKLTH